MGVNKRAETLHHFLFLAMADVAAIVRWIYQYEESVDNGLTMSMPTIAGDSNNIKIPTFLRNRLRHRSIIVPSAQPIVTT